MSIADSKPRRRPWAFWLGRLGVSVSGWQVQDDDHSCGLMLVWLGREQWDGRRSVHLVIFGFGWDDEQPWRPWPTLATTPTKGGVPGWCLCWFGLFINVRRSLRP